MTDRKAAIIGSGLIGRSWAMLFAAAGYRVVMYDKQEGQAAHALEEIKDQLATLETQGLLRGTMSREEQFKAVSTADTIEECVTGACYIQECVPERENMKTAVYADIDPVMEDTAILASSTSAILPSVLAKNLKHKNRFIVAHPTNPPFYAPLVELVPSPWADDDVLPRTKAAMDEIGQVPVVLKKEIQGFVLNRIQYSIIRESWHLIKEGIISVQDLDKVMSAGLGRRYAFMGPLETAYLNADGMYSYADRYADMIYEVMQDLAPAERMEGPVLDVIQEELSTLIPVDQLADRRQWRDKRLAALTQLHKRVDEEDSKK